MLVDELMLVGGLMLVGRVDAGWWVGAWLVG